MVSKTDVKEIKVEEIKVKEIKDESCDFPFPLRAEKGNTIMSFKAHGTTDKPVQSELKYGVDTETADRLCCFSRKPKEEGNAQDYIDEEEEKKKEPFRYAFTAPVKWHDIIKEA